MKILVLQHASCEHPGIFREFLKEDGHEWHPVELDQGETAPPLDGFDALWVMGGPMDVWQEDEHPWLQDEKRLIQDAVQEQSVILDGLPMVLDCLQWHSAEVTALPEGAKVLMTSEACAVQAMSWGPRAFSAQFHIEVEPDTVENWAQIPEYHGALVKALGESGTEKLKADCDARMSDFGKHAERLYINWLQTTARV